MPSDFKNNKNEKNAFENKPTEPNEKKLNRNAVLTAIVLALAVVIVATAVIVSNRSKDPVELPEFSESDPPQSNTQKPTETPTEPATEPSTEKPTISTPAGNKIPSFILPVSGVLSNTHDPDLQVFSPTMNDYRVHLGVDLVTKENAPVYTVADGKISKIWVDTKMGYCIAIEHSGDCVTIYKNLAETLPTGISEGATVRSGQLIATVGDSAMVEVASEPHLHFEVTVGDLSVDPLKYFDENTLSSIKKDTASE